VPHIVIGTPAAVARAARRTGDTFIDMRACSLLIGYAADGLFVDSVYDYLAEIKSCVLFALHFIYWCHNSITCVHHHSKLSKQSVQVILFSSSEFNPAFASRVQRFCPNAFRIVKALGIDQIVHRGPQLVDSSLHCDIQTGFACVTGSPSDIVDDR
jgi:hypothetical protein